MNQKLYHHIDIEKKWVDLWDKMNSFLCQVDYNKEPYSIVLPPPNITGMLTIGHVLNSTIQDILIRWKKMCGFSTCWLPGVDHAGIATENKVINTIFKKQNIAINDIKKNALISEIIKWSDEHKNIILGQLKQLGCSCDWSKKRFTLDEKYQKAVQKVFIQLYEEGYIYQNERMVNWCPFSKTALSDEEIIHKEVKGKLYYLLYPFKDNSNKYIEIATTRPETMFGDVAIAVNPNDNRYNKLIGTMIKLPFTTRTIPIIVDDIVDKNFGTGCVKITPAHDKNDFNVGVRHSLKIISVMNIDGTMIKNRINKNFRGLDRYECRKKVILEMQKLGLVSKIDERYKHSIGYSERGNVPIESRVSKQWFVKMKELVKPAIDVVKSGNIKFYPKHWYKVYFNWMENVEDWCISRQIVWGHKMPVWYNKTKGIYVGLKSPKSTIDNKWRRETDVLDTWFSSWIWPFTIMGWPENNEQQNYFYPTTDIITGPDIIFFWIARMIISSLKYKKVIPFKNVYFTGIVRDTKGKKLSKSLSNSSNPSNIIKLYGADVLRFTIIYIAPMKMDIKYSDDKCTLGRNFINKLWNLFRFRKLYNINIILQTGDYFSFKDKDFDIDEEWIIFNLNKLISNVNISLKNFNFHDVIHYLYNFIKNTLCDQFIETFKLKYVSKDRVDKIHMITVLDYILYNILKLLHPFIPFITEEILHNMNFLKSSQLATNVDYPNIKNDLFDKIGLNINNINLVTNRYNFISSIRSLRAVHSIPSNIKLQLTVVNNNKDILKYIKTEESLIKKFINITDIFLLEKYSIKENDSTHIFTIFGLVVLSNDITLNKKDTRSNKNKIKLEAKIQVLKQRLENKNFISNAPKEKIEQTKILLLNLEKMYNNLI